MMTDRRTRFRDYMRRLDPTGDPVQAIDGGFYVPPPNAVSQRIATRLELEPASSHLLVGGIGSGKTTELIAIERKLAKVEDLFPVRVDVPSRHRLDKLKPGVLIALAGMEACAELKRAQSQGLLVEAPIAEAAGHISAIAKGYWDAYANHPQSDDDSNWVYGILEEPEPSADVRVLSESLHEVQGALRRKLVVLFDGLDRVADLAVLTSVLAEDIPAMGRAKVGLVLVGPQNLRFSEHRSVEKVFETVYLHGAAGTNTEDGRQFLTSVLRARADEEVLPLDSARSLGYWSGGLLRDLVALGRAAGAEAYASGFDIIAESHVQTAADRFGRDLLLGCTKEMSARLKELVPRRRGAPGLGAPPPPGDLPAFTVATELDQRLLMDRLIIEVPETPIRYILHPTIAPLIAGLGSS
jgi:hypothetical protein